MRKTFAALAAAALVLGVGGTASAAQTSAVGDQIHACVHKKTRYARIVNTTTVCKPTETRVVWAKNSAMSQTVLNPQGARGETGATGPAGPAGPKGDAGARGWQGWRGQTGPRGPVGPTGPIGKTGDAGAPGKDGADGKNGGVVVLETLGLDLSAFGVPNITKIVCSDNTSTDPANPVFSKCVKKVTATPSATPSPTPTLTPVP